MFRRQLDGYLALRGPLRASTTVLASNVRRFAPSPPRYDDHSEKSVASLEAQMAQMALLTKSKETEMEAQIGQWRYELKNKGDLLTESKDAQIAVLNAHTAVLTANKDLLTESKESKDDKISELLRRLGIMSLRECVVELITAAFVEMQPLILTHFSDLSKEDKNAVKAVKKLPSMTAREKLVSGYSARLLLLTSVPLTDETRRVAEIYQNYPDQTIYGDLSYFHHQMGIPQSADEMILAVQNFVDSKDHKKILIGLIRLIPGPKPLGVLYVSVELTNTSGSSTSSTNIIVNVAHTLKKEELPMTVFGLKEAVLKKLHHKLKDKDVSDLTVFPPGEKKEGKPYTNEDLDTNLENAVLKVPYHIVVE